MQIYAGTSGYSYKEWKGPFYPGDLPARQMLRYYSAHLPAVEINNTFYRMPAPDMLEQWADQVPPDFRFVLKAPRKITHARPLSEKAEEIDYLYRTSTALGNHLGAIFYQLPPYLHRDEALLAAFLRQLPDDIPAVFEFRHASWFDQSIFSLLREKKAVLCWAESDKPELTCTTATAAWGYLRLRKQNYTPEDLREWAGLIERQRWHTVYVFFKHEEAGIGPRLATEFRTLVAPH